MSEVLEHYVADCKEPTNDPATRVNYIDNCDCLVGMKNIPSQSVDLIVTDPPYLIETVGGCIYKRDDTKYIRELDSMKNGFNEEVLDEFCRVLKRINIYIFCSQKQIIPLLDYFVKRKKCNWNILCWHKSNPLPTCGNKYLSDTEYILFFRDKGVKIHGEYRSKFTYYVTQLNKSDKKRYGHPTIKPIDIVQNLIINSSQPGELVLDAFMGSGTTAVSCINSNRNYMGFEIDPNYYEIACRRIEEAKQNKQ